MESILDQLAAKRASDRWSQAYEDRRVTLVVGPTGIIPRLRDEYPRANVVPRPDIGNRLIVLVGGQVETVIYPEV